VAKILATRSALEGERKSVTVLFCDVVRSTALAERLGPEGMHALLGRFFELALAHVHRYEGTVNQFLGDGFMALFGAPLAHEDHARRAVLAALDLRAALAERPIEAGGAPVSLDIRLGLHTGFVVVGAIGDLRMDYTAVGDTTHPAARLQQLASLGEILVSDATARLVRGYVTLAPRGATEIRGLSAPVTLHALIGAGERRSSLEPGERPLGHFVGRDRELRALRDLLAEVEAGRGQVVVPCPSASGARKRISRCASTKPGGSQRSRQGVRAASPIAQSRMWRKIAVPTPARIPTPVASSVHFTRLATSVPCSANIRAQRWSCGVSLTRPVCRGPDDSPRAWRG